MCARCSAGVRRGPPTASRRRCPKARRRCRRSVLVWVNLKTHLRVGTKTFIAEHDWLTVYQLPAYAPDLNPVEGIWSLIRRGPLANAAFTDPDHLIATVRRGLREIQYRSWLTSDALLTKTANPDIGSVRSIASSGGAMTEQSYARAARLIYLARYRAEKPKAALAQAHRLAARVVRGCAVGDAAVREAASRLIKMGSRSTLRYRVPGTGPYLAPAAGPARRPSTRRRQRVRIGAAIAGLVLAATATGLWRFDLRTEPLGWYADDPRIQTTVGRYNFDIDSWNARGELLGDAALLRRAASAWRERSSLKLPVSIGPMIVFAGRVHGGAAVLMTNEITGSNPWRSDSVAVYIEGAQVRDLLHTTKDHRLYVNPAYEGMQAGGIRL